ncbi:MAG: aminopeptidase P N-terminal domain-containing protein, partial [Bacteroidota bacterium]|nr:aminopeptidase P N-terminal domain-containing protein [Bacteroidota bacterium]
MFQKNVYLERRKKLKENLKTGLVFIIGNEESPMNYEDNTYHFRQDSTFLYYFGISSPGLYAVIDIDNDKEVIFGDNLTIDSIVWMGTHPSIADKARSVGVNLTVAVKELKNFLENIKKSKQEILFVNPYRDTHKIKLFNLLDIHPNNVSENASVRLMKAIAQQRSVKEEREIIEIDKAVKTTGEMHIAAMQMTRPGMSEAQIAAEIQRIAVASGGQLSFPTIATINGQTLHNHYHGNVIKEGQTMLVDAGAETSMGYAGDMSSSFPVSRKFTSQQKDIYQVALNAHEAAIAELKPGVKFKEVHLKAAATIVEGMKELGFMKGSVEDAVNNG